MRDLTSARASGFTEAGRLQQVLALPFDEQGSQRSVRYAGFPPKRAQTIEVFGSS